MISENILFYYINFSKLCIFEKKNRSLYFRFPFVFNLKDLTNEIICNKILPPVKSSYLLTKIHFIKKNSLDIQIGYKFKSIL